MSVYLVNILLICFWGFALVLFKPTDRKKKVYCTIVAMQWILISGLRHISVGADTITYSGAFERVKAMSWTHVLGMNWDYVVHGADVKDPGYTLLTKIFQIFSGDYRVYLFFIAILFTSALAIWIYKNSSMPCLSFVIYSTLFYSFYSITGHRQTIATAIIVLFGYQYVKERKLFRFLILSFIAFMIHKSSVVFIPYYFIANIALTPVYIGVVVCATVTITALGKQLYAPIAEGLGFSEDLIEYAGGGAETFVVLMLLVCAAAFVLYPRIKKNRIDAQFIYNLLFLTVLSTLLVLQNQSFMRIQQYYSLVIMIVIPELVRAVPKKIQPIFYVCGLLVIVAFLLKTVPAYRFFWQ